MDMADLDISKGWLSPRWISEYQSEETNYFEWQNGKLWVCTAEGMRKEVLYVHFQKRKLTFEPYDKDHFYLLRWVLFRATAATSASATARRKRTLRGITGKPYHWEIGQDV